MGMADVKPVLNVVMMDSIICFAAILQLIVAALTDVAPFENERRYRK